MAIDVTEWRRTEKQRYGSLELSRWIRRECVFPSPENSSYWILEAVGEDADRNTRGACAPRAILMRRFAKKDESCAIFEKQVSSGKAKLATSHYQIMTQSLYEQLGGKDA